MRKGAEASGNPNTDPLRSHERSLLQIQRTRSVVEVFKQRKDVTTFVLGRLFFRGMTDGRQSLRTMMKNEMRRWLKRHG